MINSLQQQAVNRVLESPVVSDYQAAWSNADMDFKLEILRELRIRISHQGSSELYELFSRVGERVHSRQSTRISGSVRAPELIAGPGISESLGPSTLFLESFAMNNETLVIRLQKIWPHLLDSLRDVRHSVLLVNESCTSKLGQLRQLSEKFPVSVFSMSKATNLLSATTLSAKFLMHRQPLITEITNVQNHMGIGGVNLADPLLTKRVRTVLRVAGDEMEVRVLSEAYPYFERVLLDLIKNIFVFRNVSAIIAMSPWEKKRIQRLAPTNTRVIESFLGIDPDRFQDPQSNDLKVRRTRHRLLYLGRKSEEKGWRQVEDLAQVSRVQGHDIDFIFAGRGFPEGRNQNMVFKGFVEHEDTPKLLRDVDGLILFSRTEGFPNVLAEGLSSGLPCFVIDDRYKEAYGSETGIIQVKSDAREALGEISALLQSPRLNEFRKSIRSQALRRFDSNRWKRVYKSVITGEK